MNILKSLSKKINMSDRYWNKLESITLFPQFMIGICIFMMISNIIALEMMKNCLIFCKNGEHQ